MKLIRKNNQGLQVLRVHMAAPGKASFTLFPMIHIADRAFFDQVKSGAHTHNAVFMEGVRALIGRTANRAHRIATAGDTKMTAQGRSFHTATPGNRKADAAKTFNSDISADEFHQHWAKVPRLKRFLFHVVLLGLGLALRFEFARNAMINALHEFDQIKAADTDAVLGKGFHNAIIASRDVALLANCERAMERWVDGRVAVVWGAAHLPQLIGSLTDKHGYEIVNKDWMTAIAA